MNRQLGDKFVRVPVVMDVRTFVQLAGKAKRNGLSFAKNNSNIIVALTSKADVKPELKGKN